jgi:hypothetical protein
MAELGGAGYEGYIFKVVALNDGPGGRVLLLIGESGIAQHRRSDFEPVSALQLN